MNKKIKNAPTGLGQPLVSIPYEGQCLDSVQLNLLEQSFREWAGGSPREDVSLSRRRILIVFLLIRYTGAKLNEVLTMNPFHDIDPERQAVCFRNPGAEQKTEPETCPREIQISEALCREISAALANPGFRNSLKYLFNVDPGFVRRKFYDRAEACGFQKRLGGPEMIRKARAVELMQSNMPLPAIRMMMGHSALNLTASYVSFSPDEIQQVMRLFMEREASRKTSARNSFFGKIIEIQRGDIQARVVMTTLGGHSLTTVITNYSLDVLGLKKGRLITAEVKAPWVMLQKGAEEPLCSSENRFNGVIERITSGSVNTEYAVRISDGTELSAVMSTESSRRLALKTGDPIWATFNCFAVVLRLD